MFTTQPTHRDRRIPALACHAGRSAIFLSGKLELISPHRVQGKDFSHAALQNCTRAGTAAAAVAADWRRLLQLRRSANADNQDSFIRIWVHCCKLPSTHVKPEHIKQQQQQYPTTCPDRGRFPGFPCMDMLCTLDYTQGGCGEQTWQTPLWPWTHQNMVSRQALARSQTSV
jgi:hypothetical protein